MTPKPRRYRSTPETLAVAERVVAELPTDRADTTVQTSTYNGLDVGVRWTPALDHPWYQQYKGCAWLVVRDASRNYYDERLYPRAEHEAPRSVLVRDLADMLEDALRPLPKPKKKEEVAG